MDCDNVPVALLRGLLVNRKSLVVIIFHIARIVSHRNDWFPACPSALLDS